MNNILFVAPLHGNGGIASWAANYRRVMHSNVNLISIGVSKRRALRGKVTIFNVFLDGLLDLREVLHDIRKTLKSEKDVSLMHMTTSGGYGTFRDFFIVRFVKRMGIKSIMHCHYGCISEDYSSKGLIGFVLRRTLRLFDQIWVLDRKSFQTLDQDPNLHGKIELVPNFLEVSPSTTYTEKDFYHVGFVGNLIPTKGIYDLTAAVKACENTKLDIIGPGEESVINKIIIIAGEEFENRIFLHGKVDNSTAIKMMQSIDILGLPTYFPSEAFPISILEAMSLSKMVVSCDRAAISDMLMGNDGKLCGLLVPPQSPTDIIAAIKWCQSHRREANEMCKNAYRKVYESYRTEVVVKMCLDNYQKLL